MVNGGRRLAGTLVALGVGTYAEQPLDSIEVPWVGVPPHWPCLPFDWTLGFLFCKIAIVCFGVCPSWGVSGSRVSWAVLPGGGLRPSPLLSSSMGHPRPPTHQAGCCPWCWARRAAESSNCMRCGDVCGTQPALGRAGCLLFWKQGKKMPSSKAYSGVTSSNLGAFGHLLQAHTPSLWAQCAGDPLSC